jgi:hypothetical protein
MRPVIGILMLAGIAAVVFPAWAQETCTDSVFAWVGGDHVRVFHTGALYNCCPTRFDYDVFVEWSSILVVENEILENPCYCVCCIDLETEIEGLAPGAYVLVFRWYDYETYEWRDWPLEIEVDDVGQGTPEPSVARAWFSDCYGSSAGVAEEEPPTTWGMIKSLYR